MTIPRFNTISLSQDDGIGHLVLNQPPSNKMTLDFFREFREVVDYIVSEKAIRGLVISGSGRHFSSGTDLQSLFSEITSRSKVNGAGKPGEVPGFLADNYQSLYRLGQLTIPVVAAIRGVCLGSALELALFSHFRFCSGDAVFALPETTFNLIPGLGGISKLAEICGKARAIELVLQGVTYPAERAMAYGVVDRILPKRSLVASSVEFARSISNDYRKEKKPLYLKQDIA